MKVQYREVKTWECPNPDGSTVVVSEGDKVKIEYDADKNVFSDAFNERHPDSKVDMEVHQLFKNKIFGVELGALPGHYVELKCNQIVSIEKI